MQSSLRAMEYWKPEVVHNKFGTETWSDGRNVALAPDDSFIATAYGDSTVEVTPWKLVCSKKGKFSDKPFVVHCDGHVLSLAFGYSKSVLYDLDGNFSQRRPFHNLTVPENQLILAIGLHNGRIRIYSILSQKFLMELVDHAKAVRDVTFSPSVVGPLVLLSASLDGTLKLWDMSDDGNMFKTLSVDNNNSNSGLLCCSWASNGRYLASGGLSNSVLIYETATWKSVRVLRSHSHNVSSCDFSPNGALLVTTSFDTTAVLWDYLAGTQLYIFYHLVPIPSRIYLSGENEHYVRCVAHSPDAQHVATVCDDNFLHVWNSIGGSDKSEYKIEVFNPVCVRYSSNGDTIFVGTRDGSLYRYSAPMRVQTLLSLCRTQIRRLVKSDDVADLGVPRNLANFLLYR